MSCVCIVSSQYVNCTLIKFSCNSKHVVLVCYSSVSLVYSKLVANVAISAEIQIPQFQPHSCMVLSFIRKSRRKCYFFYQNSSLSISTCFAYVLFDYSRPTMNGTIFADSLYWRFQVVFLGCLSFTLIQTQRIVLQQ